jgi:hypothetical protein
MAIKNQEKGQFKKGQSGNPNGRPRKYVSTLVEIGYKKSEVNDCILAMMAMTLEELQEAYKSKSATVMEKTIANAIITGIRKGNLSSVETLLDRVYGKPKQEIEQKVTKIKPPAIKFYRAEDEEE